MHRGNASSTRTTASADRGRRPQPRPPVSKGGRVGTTRSVLGGLCGLGVAVVALVLLWGVARHSPAADSRARLDDLLLAGLAWLGVGLAAWLAAGCVVAVLCLLPGSAGRAAARLADRVTPLAVRRFLTLVLGASVGSVALPAAPLASAGTAPVVGVAGATEHGRPGPAFVPTPFAPAGPSGAPAVIRSGAGTVSPGFVPTVAPQDRDPGTPQPAAPSPGYVPTAPPPVLRAAHSTLLAPQPRAAAAAHDLVTVRRGDTLWAIAARHLGDATSDAHVASEWPRWYAVNRAVIGDDPDLLVPGQQLRPPPPETDGAPPTADRADRGGVR